jgi:hypothetical protein
MTMAMSLMGGTLEDEKWHEEEIWKLHRGGALVSIVSTLRYGSLALTMRARKRHGTTKDDAKES